MPLLGRCFDEDLITRRQLQLFVQQSIEAARAGVCLPILRASASYNSMMLHL